MLEFKWLVVCLAALGLFGSVALETLVGAAVAMAVLVLAIIMAARSSQTSGRDQLHRVGRLMKIRRANVAGRPIDTPESDDLGTQN